MAVAPGWPDRDAFEELRRGHPVVPVTRRLLADAETPVGAYRKLAGGRPGTFLLESAGQGGVWSRYSFVGARAAAILTSAAGRARWRGRPPAGVPRGGDPLAVLRDTLAALAAPRLAGLPPLLGGLVGYLGYDAVRRLERVGEHAADDLALPELAFLLATDLAVLDHSDGTVLLVATVLPGGTYDEALARLDRMAARLARASPSPVVAVDPAVAPNYRRMTSAADYRAAVAAAQRHIRAGEAFQVVLSQRFDVATSADPLDVYRMLRAANPSPYMYLVRTGELDVVGCSPEALVTLSGEQVVLRPIAGTRPRGATAEQDAALAAQLRGDAKERAEHVMLVDLGRNDAGRVCRPGTVEVLEFATVERYSHVMHLVSTVVGQVRPDCAALDVLLSCFPAGTLSGAPKPRALQIIEALEPTRRGVYGGAVGYFDFAGGLDTAIAIRTVVMRGGAAYVQAGAGIVADSDPAAEDGECAAKAAVVLRALAAAETLRAGPAAR